MAFTLKANTITIFQLSDNNNIKERTVSYFCNKMTKMAVQGAKQSLKDAFSQF